MTHEFPLFLSQTDNKIYIHLCDILLASICSGG